MKTILRFIFVAMIVGATPALGQNDPATASAHFRAALEAAKGGDHRKAIIEYEEAYRLAPNYNLYYNLSFSHLELARIAIKRYLDEGGDRVPSARKEEATKQLKALNELLGK